MKARSILVITGLVVGMPLVAWGQLEIVDDLPGIFIDISGTGTPLGLSGDEEIPITTTISNAVFPGGQVIVANNGGLGFGNLANTNLEPINQPIPSSGAFGDGLALLPLWDDIGNTIGEVLWSQQGDRLIVQWDSKRFEGSMDTATFQVQIFDGVPFPPAGGIFAQMLYADIEQPRPGGGVSATIGYQDTTGDFPNTVQWSFNTAGAVANGTVLSLIPEPATLTLLCLGGVFATRRRG